MPAKANACGPNLINTQVRRLPRILTLGICTVFPVIREGYVFVLLFAHAPVYLPTCVLADVNTSACAVGCKTLTRYRIPIAISLYTNNNGDRYLQSQYQMIVDSQKQFSHKCIFSNFY